MTAQPWLAGWNYSVLKHLFHILPHRGRVDNFFEFLTLNHLVSTWIFAAAFYLIWSIQDEKTPWRRSKLFQTVLGIGVAVTITIMFRPWLAWPAPSLNQNFRNLYPNYFWGTGTANSFPSHSTLIYLMVSLGVWRLNRRVSMFLIVYTLVCISLPRVYVGGHYPIDILASIGLGLLTMFAVGEWRVPSGLQTFLARPAFNAIRELLLVLWIFELAQEFGDVLDILRKLRHLI